MSLQVSNDELSIDQDKYGATIQTLRTSGIWPQIIAVLGGGPLWASVSVANSGRPTARTIQFKANLPPFCPALNSRSVKNLCPCY